MKRRLTGTAGQTLLEVLQTAAGETGADHAGAPCGGRGVCGKCRLRVLEESPAAASGRPGDGCLEPPSAGELPFLSPSDLELNTRLSCRARWRTPGTVTVEIPDENIVALSESLAGDYGSSDHPVGVTAEKPLRLAVDLGTTTIACVLLDARGRTALGSVTEPNRQRTWGSDVVSRIAAGADPGTLRRMSGVVTAQLQDMLGTLLAGAGRKPAEVESILVCGNTTMLHLLLACDPSGLGRLPFTPVFLEARHLPASEAGFTDFPGSLLVLLPGISAFVGADLSSGILATDLYRAESPELLIDIGTNGEIILRTPSGMTGTATAAGPAFEGARIACGSAGVPGAVDHAGWDDGGFWFTTIGGAPPSGICGSGLLDILASLRLRGILDETGLLECEDGPDGTPWFFLNPGKTLYLTQADIRHLQLAKGAIAAGIRVLCLKEGIPLSAIRRVHLAGGFGTFMNPVSALAAGLLPLEFNGKIRAAGNTALRGVIRAALTHDGLAACSVIAGNTRVTDLAAEPEFQDEFMEAMMFPDDESLKSLYAEVGSV